MKQIFLIMLVTGTWIIASDKSSDGRRTPDSTNSSVTSTASTGSAKVTPKKQSPRSWKNRRRPSDSDNVTDIPGHGVGCC